MDLSIRASSTGSEETSFTTIATFMSIMVMEWAWDGMYVFGGRKPGVESILRMFLNMDTAFSAYPASPDAAEYSAMAMAAKHSEKT